MSKNFKLFSPVLFLLCLLLANSARAGTNPEVIISTGFKLIEHQ